MRHSHVGGDAELCNLDRTADIERQRRPSAVAMTWAHRTGTHDRTISLYCVKKYLSEPLRGLYRTTEPRMVGRQHL